jgi:hypothetical protein
VVLVPEAVGVANVCQQPGGAGGADPGQLHQRRAALDDRADSSGFQTLSWMGAFRWLRSRMLQEPEIERPKHQDDPDIDHQPLP